MSAALIPIGLEHFLVLSGLLFVIGLAGVVINRRHLIVLLISIEVMLLAVNINFVAFSHFGGHGTGQILALFVLAVAAAEMAIGLAILVVAFRSRGNLDVMSLSEMKG